MAAIVDLLPLFRELNDLKRIRVADRDGSIAQRLFRRSWARLLAGQPLQTVALCETARAVVAARLAGIDADVLADGGLNAGEQLEVLERAFDAVANGLPVAFAARLRAQLTPKPSGSLTIRRVSAVQERAERKVGIEVEGEKEKEESAQERAEGKVGTGVEGKGEKEKEESAQEMYDMGLTPPFVELLGRQQRAGATRPGRARVVLEPTENHAEHCGLVAVNGALAASLYGADAGQVFLTGLCHHLHNAYLPDAGDAGDALLGEHHPLMMERFRERALAQLPAELVEMARASLDSVYRADTPESRAFQVADSLDRVLEMEWHARSAEFTLDVALEQMDIIHPGPVQAFQLEIMREAGLM